MLATVLAATLQGIDGRVIRVETDVAPGLPGFTIVGLADTALQESRERVRGAIRNSGLAFPPRRITANLAPADLRKTGASLDLAIAVAILLGSEQVRATGRWAFLGELSLGGELRPVPGILPMVSALGRRGARRIVVPADAAVEASLAGVPGVEPAATLEDVVAILRSSCARRARRLTCPPARVELTLEKAGSSRFEPWLAPPPGPPADGRAMEREYEGLAPNGGRLHEGAPNGGAATAQPDLTDVRGQALGRRALEIALAGGHGLVLVGPPGSGKTLLARTIPGLLPPLNDDEARVASAIASAAGDGPLTGLIRRRPFRAPHHTISYAGMIGGGPRLAPGEISRACDGVLFLDELPEFGRDVLEALRQPMEAGCVTIVRAGGAVTLPARFQLVAAMNPCPCGGAAGPDGGCRCTSGLPERYAARVSGPLRDRIDLWAQMPPVPAAIVIPRATAESSAAVAVRIARVRVVAHARNGGPNAWLAGSSLRAACGLQPTDEEHAGSLSGAIGLSARGVERLLRVARTIADLDRSDFVGRVHLEEAAHFRVPIGSGTNVLAR